MNSNNNSEETFKVRAYGFGELAQLYFPNITKKSASAQLRRCLKSNCTVLLRLEKVGYKLGNRLLLPIQVKVLVDEFGEP